MSQVATLLLDFLERLRATTTLDEAWQVYMGEICKYGATHAGYGVTTGASDFPDGAIRYYDYREDFLRRYDEAGHFVNDSSVAHCVLGRKQPLISTDPRFLPSLTPAQLQVAHESFDFGIRHFVTFTLGEGAALGGVNIAFTDSSTREFHEALGQHGDLIRLISVLFHHVITTGSHLASEMNLTPREKECLRWVAVGLESKEIAHRLGISTRTVDHHIGNAIVKMRAHSRTHAVARALVLHVIEL